MRMLTKWVLTGLLMYFFSYIGWFISIQSIEGALILSLAVALIHTLIRLLAGLLVGAGCFTLGLSIIPGIILGLLSLPLALWKGQEIIKGVFISSFVDAVLLAVVLTVALEFVQNVLYKAK